jgi:hypothetical protein
MKIEALKEYIKKTVQQEIRSILREELKYQLTEILLGNNSNVVESKKDESVSLSSLLESETESVKQQTPKKTVKYTSNPVLNEILNETQGGVPREGELVGLIGDGFGGTAGREQINEVKAPENAPKEVKTVYQAMNKDYRSLMKAVDKKRNKG